MQVSVLIVNYFSCDKLSLCLESLFALPQGVEFEVLLVNNSLQDDLKNVKVKYPRVKIFTPKKNLGFGKGNNFGAQHTQGEYLFILNPDTRLLPNTLLNLYSYAKQSPQIGLLAPQLRYSETEIQSSARRFPDYTHLFANRLNHQFLNQKREEYLMLNQDLSFPQSVPWVVGAAMFLPHKLWKTLGGFDERFFLFFEDTDLCRRVWQEGRSVYYTPQIYLFHARERLSASGFFKGITKKTTWYHTFSALKYFLKWRGKVLPKF